MGQTWTIGLKSSIITILGLIAYRLLLQIVGLPNTLIAPFQYLIWAVGIYSAHYYYKQANNDLLSYQQGLKLGLMVSLGTGLFNGLAISLYLNNSTSATKQVFYQELRHKLQQAGTEPAVIDKSLLVLQEMSSTHWFLITLLAQLLLGLLITLPLSAASRSYKKDA